MISQKQHKANCINAKKGGVKTPHGKNKVRFNARKHGILANLIADYEENFFKNYADYLFEELNPNNCIEEILVERIVLNYLKLFRLMKAENEYIKNCLYPDIENFSLELKTVDGYTPKINHEQFATIVDIYNRYETSTENRLYKAIYALKELQKSK